MQDQKISQSALDNGDIVQDFEQFLQWLARDEPPGEGYEILRRRLIVIYSSRNPRPVTPGDLADQCIDRVVQLKPWVNCDPDTPPLAYILRVANYIYLEWGRSLDNKLEPFDPNVHDRPKPSESAVEQYYSCLEVCLSQLTENCRTLILEYYQHENGSRNDHHAALADKLGVGANALRIRAYRIRRRLEQTMLKCIASNWQINRGDK